MRHIGKAQFCRYLLDAEVAATQVETYLLYGVLDNPVRGCLVAVFQAEHCQIFGCDGQLRGVVGYRLALNGAARDEAQEAVEQNFALRQALVAFRLRPVGQNPTDLQQLDADKRHENLSRRPFVLVGNL